MILLIDNDLLIGFLISDYRLVRLGLELPVRHRKSDNSEYTGFKFPALFKNQDIYWFFCTDLLQVLKKNSL